MSRDRVCFITGSRAEYGILKQLIKAVHLDPGLELQIICTNMHLSPEFGLTFREVEADGFHIDRKVEMLLSSDTAVGTSKSMGLAMIGFADAFAELNPDIFIIPGDRYEMLAAASTALVFRIPIAHLHGGEITEGAYDDSIRHAITKLSHLHFTSTEEYRSRVIQLGEDPEKVFDVGALGVENMKSVELLSREDFEKSINFKLHPRNIIVTFHPVTLDKESAIMQIDSLLEALAQVDVGLIFTFPNSDSEGRDIIERIKSFVANNSDRSVMCPSLGQLRYLSALKHVDAVVGNSSSGIIEAPSFKIPTLNIGNRQTGRIAADSVVDCSIDPVEIRDKLKLILSNFCEGAEFINPYEKEDTAKNILQELKKFLEASGNKVIKKFYDI